MGVWRDSFAAIEIEEPGATRYDKQISIIKHRGKIARVLFVPLT